jgi:hypothetical protein
MYNEVPHNDIKFQASPFIGDINDPHFRIVLNDLQEPLYLAKDGKLEDLKNSNYKASLLIENNQNKMHAK